MSLKLPYNPNLKQRAKELRQAGNLAEVILWNKLKNKQLLNLDFNRQKIIGNYIVDFFCPSLKTIIEIDGSSHNDKQEYDAIRQAYLKGLGLQFIRLLDTDVKNNIDGVVFYLQEKLHNII